WDATSLYSFCAKRGCKDGEQPYAPVALDSAGNLFGVAEGGAGKSCPSNYDSCGVVYEFLPNASPPAERVLHNFCALPDCADGVFPLGAGLTVDSAGAAFGMTQGGGGHDIDQNGYGGGTIFQVKGKNFQTLYSFCSQADCVDGAYPHAALIEDAAGNLYGT